MNCNMLSAYEKQPRKLLVSRAEVHAHVYVCLIIAVKSRLLAKIYLALVMTGDPEGKPDTG